jgi:tetratricopeptide (TPR) repeat protein
MEIRFREAKQLYDEDEIEEALVAFKELIGPEMNHKRGLYYAARCCEKLDDFEGVKVYCNAYIKMQPRDAEVWEMISNAHKKLFEYEEAEDASQRAQQLK